MNCSGAANRLLRRHSAGRRRGVSPVISSVLMTAIVVFLGTMIVATGLYSLTTQGSLFELLLGSETEKMREEFVVVDVWFNSSNRIHLAVYNFGVVSVKVVSVYLNGTLIEGLDEVEISPGEQVWIDLSEPWTAGSTYFISLVSERGNVDASFWKA